MLVAIIDEESFLWACFEKGPKIQAQLSSQGWWDMTNKNVVG